MPVDIKESLSRKIGPLPAWGWGIAVAGAVIILRVVRGGSVTSSGGVTAGTPATVGDTVTGSDSTDSTDLTDLETQVGDLTTQIADLITGQETSDAETAGLISGLTSTIGSLTSFQALQQQLTDALSKVQNLMLQRESINRRLADNEADYKSKRISKATYTNRKNRLSAGLTATNAEISQINTLIANIRSQIAAIGATP